MNKACGGYGIPAELFQILKDDAVKVLHSICQQIWKAQQWPQDWERAVFIPIPKERQCQGMFKLPYNCAHFICQQGNAQNPLSLASTVHEPRPYMCESQLQKRQRNQRSNCKHWLNHRKSKGIPKKICFCFTHYATVFNCVDHNKLWNILKEIGIPDNLTCLL